ncbi:capsule assembly Wzi family protein [Phocaeicola paurosaccharolyticus]|uniref:capsule assembly Wzi family protein n=1 Tax=Phocaeicola paurosaccharolyticus TaxID=732242 RepID=UPI002FDFCB84
MFRHRRLLIFLISLISIPAYSNEFQGISYKVESSVVLSDGDHSPFWLTSNRYGLSSIKNNWGVLKAGATYTKSFNNNWKLETGLEVAAMHNTNSDFVIQQAYADISYKRLFLSIGSKEEEPYLINPSLSSGDLIEGINTRPIPRIKIGLKNYTSIPKTNNWVKIKGYVSFGWFADNDWQRSFVNKGSYYTNNVLIHRKEVFLKIGRMDKFPVELEMGVNHGVQFGGERWRKGDASPVDKMPHSFSDHVRVLFCGSGGDKSLKGEQLNALGNHIGSWNFALKFKFNDYLIKTYFQHMFEDGSGMIFEYGAWKDGLVGISVKREKKGWIDEFLVEYLATKRQTASMQNEGWSDIPTKITGTDDYYNNGIYLAWQHHGMGLGNPLLTSPIYNNNTISFLNNRITGYHIAVSGTPLSCIRYRAMITLTNNYGTYSNPYDKCEKQLNSMLEVSYSPSSMKGWTFTASAAYDKGEVTGDNFGGMLTITKVGNLNFNCNKRK